MILVHTEFLIHGNKYRELLLQVAPDFELSLKSFYLHLTYSHKTLTGHLKNCTEQVCPVINGT